MPSDQNATPVAGSGNGLATPGCPSTARRLANSPDNSNALAAGTTRRRPGMRPTAPSGVFHPQLRTCWVSFQ